MNKIWLKRAINYFQFLMFILAPTIMFAPPIPPNPGGSGPITPIDGGLGFLLIAGASYGIKRLLDTRNQHV